MGAIDAYGEVETRLFQWRDSNPEPDKESSAWIEWLQREVAFRRECGCDAAEAAEGVASDRLHSALTTLCATPARTIRGLAVKTRLAEIDQDALGNFIRPSIFADLRALAAVDAA